MTLSYFTIGLITVTLLVTPALLSHWFAEDAGLPLFTNGEMSLEKSNIDSAHLHLCAVMALAELTMYALMIVISRQENNRDLVAFFYVWYMIVGTILQFTHPIMGKPPASVVEMPMPLLCVLVIIVFGGYMMDKKNKKQDESKKVKSN